MQETNSAQKFLVKRQQTRPRGPNLKNQGTLEILFMAGTSNTSPLPYSRVVDVPLQGAQAGENNTTPELLELPRCAKTHTRTTRRLCDIVSAGYYGYSSPPANRITAHSPHSAEDYSVLNRRAQLVANSQGKTMAFGSSQPPSFPKGSTIRGVGSHQRPSIRFQMFFLR